MSAGAEHTRELWREVFEAADRALEMESREREAFIQRCLHERPAVGAELKALIDAAATPSALEASASAFGAAFLAHAAGDELLDDTAASAAGAEFGPYRVVRELGSGGMGVVYLAARSDDQYRKEVALKVLPRWIGGHRRRLQRFLEERQILATLDHPGIARLLDGGVTPDRVPWFAMEYIDGEHVDRYCERRGLPIDERLRLFCEICSAVQYAHRNLVVHRDLKPSNILVAPTGRVALLDFGIARMLAEQHTMTAGATTGDRLLTPLYSSPEQIRGEPASTAADVYALGVVLHVLLTGSNPYRLSSFDGYEVARAVLEQDPERPSVTAARAGASPKLARRLRGDLDAIVLKAMSREPARRYATVEQLETDVRRHLHGLPVVAQPESRMYVVRKFVGRHRTGVAASVAASLLVLGFAAVMTVQRSRIRDQANRIALERDRAEGMGAGLMNIFRNVAPGARGVAARDVLDSATARIDAHMLAYPEQRARLMMEMARAYRRLELNDRARRLLDVTLRLRRDLPKGPAAEVAVAETLDLLGAVLLAQDSVARADSAYREALLLRRRVLAPRHADVARTLVGLSAVRRAQRRFADAERLASEAVEIDRSRGRAGRADLARSTSALATAVASTGDARAAAALFRNALAVTRASHTAEDADVAAAVFDLAAALHGAGEHREADSLIRYGLALNRRVLTAALLTGSVNAPGLGTTNEVNATVKRAFEERAAPVARQSGGAVAPASVIAFVSDRDGPDAVGNAGNQEIYVMHADGTDQRRLTNYPGQDMTPAISPDGRTIAFTSTRAGGWDIFVMNADGTEPRQLTHFTELGIGAVGPAWSPDGKRIAFRSRNIRVNIHAINIDGTGVVQLGDGPGTDPAWSPDGKRIAFTSRREARADVAGGRQEIYTMAADGSDVVRLTNNNAGDSAPAWSPDGRRIAFQSDRDGNAEIYVMNADGTNPVRLTFDPAEDGHPWWSPDGRQIVFHRRVLGHGQVFVMNADGTHARRLTDLSPVAFSGFPTWGRASR